MAGTNEKEEVTKNSVLASAALVILKLLVGIITGSIGILSEAAHSSIDLLATIITFFAVRIGGKPADEKHHFGHGKIESVAAFVETGLLFATSALVIFEAGKKIISGNYDIEVAWYSFAVMVISIVVDYLRSNALSRVAKETGSQAMKADALNFRADMLSSGVVIVGLIMASLGWPVADAVASIGVSLLIIFAGWKLFRQTVDILIDAAPEGLENQIIAIAKKIPEVIDIAKIRVRPVGNLIFVDMTIHVSRKYSVEQIHQIKSRVAGKIRKSLPEIDINLNAVPLTLDDETIIDQIRLTGYNHSLAVHDISIHNHGEKRFISFDVEIESKTSLSEAHAKVHKLESLLTKEIGGEVEIVIHLEPQYEERKMVEDPSAAELEKVCQAIARAASEIKTLSGTHKIEATKHKGKLHVTLHCYADASLPLEEVHKANSRLDHLVRKYYSLVERVTIHTEPKENE